MDNRRLWIALTRPDKIVEALALALAAREKFGECRLVHEDSPWWKDAGWDAYRGQLAGVDAIAKVRSCRGLRDVPRFYRDLKARQRRLLGLGIRDGDAVVCLAGITGLANAIASAYPRVPKVLCVALKKYVDASRPADFRRYRHTTSSWLHYRFLEPAVGLGRTLHLKPWRSRGGDGVRLDRLHARLEDVFESIVVLSNAGSELPAGAGESVFAAPFPNLDGLDRLADLKREPAQSEERQAVFFGTPFLLVRNLPPEQYAAMLNGCLDFLRSNYAPRCRLVYRPHPAETRERELLRLEGFTFEEDHEVAELYFLKNFRAIEAVYSVSSTVSRVACNYGLNGYCLWRCFPFADSAAAYFESLMGRVPPEFEIRSLENPPVKYAGEGGALPANGNFSQVLLEAVERATQRTAEGAEKQFAHAKPPPV